MLRAALSARADECTIGAPHQPLPPGRASDAARITVACTVQVDERSKVICALFHDISDGQGFGALVASEALRAFTEQFHTELLSTVNLKMFQGFGGQFNGIVRGCVQPVLAEVGAHKWCTLAVLIANGAVVHATERVDEVAVVANVQPLLTATSALLESRAAFITLDAAKWRIFIAAIGESAQLVVVGKAKTAETKAAPAVQKAVDLLGQVYALLENISGAE